MSVTFPVNEWQTEKLPYVDFSYIAGEKIIFCREVMKPGGGGPMHRHDETEELIFVAEGEVEITVGEETRTFGPGEAVVIPRGTVHGVKTPKGATFYLTFSPSRGEVPSYDYYRVDGKTGHDPCLSTHERSGKGGAQVTTVETTGESNIREFKLFDEELRQNWLTYSQEWATSEPFFVYDREMPHFICGRYDDVRELFLARDAFTVEVPERPGYERYDPDNGMKAITHVDGEAHDRLRRLLQPTFSQQRIDGFKERIQSVVDGLLDAIEEKGEFDAVADFGALLMPGVVLGSLLGLEKERHRPFLRRHEISPLTKDIPVGGAVPKEYVETFEEARRVIAEVIAEKEHGAWGDDFVSTMLRARAEGADISDEEIFANFFVIGAAAATTTATGAGMLQILALNRGEFEKLQANPSLASAALDECLRVRPAGMFVFVRFATQDVEIAGVVVPEGTPAYPCVTAANLDPTRYPDPMRVDFERRPPQTMTFGAGAHYCLGALLAQNVLRIALLSVAKRFPELDLVDPEFEPTYYGQLGELRPLSIPMRVR